MKKILFITALMSLTGCMLFQNRTAVLTLGKAAGISAGYACRYMRWEGPITDTAVIVLEKAQGTLPKSTDESCVTLWDAKADEIIQKLVEEGKLDEKYIKGAKLAVLTVAKGMDKVYAKYPRLYKDTELVDATLVEFTVGFKSVVQSIDGLASASFDAADLEIYEYLVAELRAACE